MRRLSILPTLLSETFLTEPFEREPESDLFINDAKQVKSLLDAGRKSGLLEALYVFHAAWATRTIFGSHTVLDLGCGTAIPLIKMARLNPETYFVGFDPSPAVLERARQLSSLRQIKNIEFVRGEITNLNAFAKGTIDAVISMQAFHQLPDKDHLDKTFQEIQKVLRPGGAVYLQDLLRLKRRSSTTKFAHYDHGASYLAQRETERSMLAAFSFPDFLELNSKYLPETAKSYKTGLADLCMVMKTATRPIDEVTEQRIITMEKNLRSRSRTFFKDIKLMHRLGGLK